MKKQTEAEPANKPIFIATGVYEDPIFPHPRIHLEARADFDTKKEAEEIIASIPKFVRLKIFAVSTWCISETPLSGPQAASPSARHYSVVIQVNLTPTDRNPTNETGLRRWKRLAKGVDIKFDVLPYHNAMSIETYEALIIEGKQKCANK